MNDVPPMKSMSKNQNDAAATIREPRVLSLRYSVSLNVKTSISLGDLDVALIELGTIEGLSSWIDPAATATETIRVCLGAALCRGAEQAILIDTGIGPFADEFEYPMQALDLVDALSRFSCNLDEISTVIVTHLDDDHSGGLVRRNRSGGLVPAFPDARVVVHRSALDTLTGRSSDRDEFAERIAAILTEGGVNLVAVGDDEFAAPGVRLYSTPGHRLGHASVEIRGSTGKLVHLGDAIHAREHVAHPEWDRLHDSDPALALRTRRREIEALVASDAVVACSHVDSLGKIELLGGLPGWIDL